MFEAHENENIKTSRAAIPARSGIPRKSNLPRKVGPNYSQANTRTTVKRSSSFDSKTRQKPTIQKRTMSGGPRQRDRAGSDGGDMSERRPYFLSCMDKDNLKTVNKFGLRRTQSDNDISAKKSSPILEHFQLRRSNSWSALVYHSEVTTDEAGKRRNTPQKRSNRGGIPRPRAQAAGDSTLVSKPGLRKWPSDGKSFDPINRKLSDQPLSMQRKYVESKANKIEAREKALREEKDRSPTKGSRPTLRRTRSASEYDRKQNNVNSDKPKGILLKSHSLDEPESSRSTQISPRKNTSQGVKINGVYVNKEKENVAAKPSLDKKKAKEVKKNVEENEKEGARNFARCLLGILPSVLSLSDPVAVDEALQQFASDVCEAVTCMALKRKNVPNFGTLRGRSDLVDEKSGEGAMSDPSFPILNADGVYVTVYATMTLNLKLLKSGYYRKKAVEPAMKQVIYYNLITVSTNICPIYRRCVVPHIPLKTDPSHLGLFGKQCGFFYVLIECEGDKPTI